MRRRMLHAAAALVRTLRGEVSTARLVARGLRVGRNFNREGGVRIDTSHCHLISIGDDVTLAPNVHILAHDASLKTRLGVVRIGTVDIGDDVFVGAGSIILPGVSIGSDIIVGAGSVVTQDLGEPGVYAGNPARRVASMQDFEARARSGLATKPVFAASRFQGAQAARDAAEIRAALAGGRGYQVCQELDRLGLPNDLVQEIRDAQR